MPDISMCNSDKCPRKATCYRHEASGTKPDELRQAWFVEPPLLPDGRCTWYWEARR